MLRTRFVAAVLALFALVVVVVTIWRRAGSMFTPEEVNTLLQSKDASVVSIAKRQLVHQCLEPPFLKGSSIPNWKYEGSTLVKSDEYVRLTSGNPHQAGSLWTQYPIDAESFEMELTFHITGPELMGDGMAIWLTNSPSPIGDVFGARNYFTGLGVFIDTFRNGPRGEFPFVNVMVGDSQLRYDKATDGIDTRIAGCSARELVNPQKGPTKMRLVYLRNGYLSIDFNWSGVRGQWMNCVTLSNIKLPQFKYLGMSAETGDLSETVDVLENVIYSLEKPSGGFIDSIEQIEQIIEEAPVNDAKMQQRRRKSVARLKAAEKRIKERERQQRLEKYGSADAIWWRRQWWRLIAIAKWTVLTLILVVVVWFGRLVVKGYRQNRKSKVTGLLD
ncbi:hypothetical protein DIURU_001149 [Diutina rugosa]|uniref:L-type lectin-like domain-containing protein n=1 Tax=Diutina rugosa TaxID=5481 RepID=A0A642UVB3_DIURU|nr:uncharacterized protein DIURU_001149 [Diutina rugosa]KAA8906207.1 hypothetical protein DIURU_001149 [Diutina rugosa]